MSEWKVELHPEEKAFIDEVFRRTIETEDGRGRMIAPIRGGVIFLDEEYDGYTEDQQKWLVLHRLLNNPDRLHSGFKGMKFMNFNFNGELPIIGTDPEAEDKWGVPRMTTDGQPLDVDGYPVTEIIQAKEVHQNYAWDAEAKEYKLSSEYEVAVKMISDSGNPVPKKLVE